MKELLVGERFEEFDQIMLFAISQLERPKDARFVRVIHLAASRVVIEDFFQCYEAAVVHVRRSKRDVPQCGRSKLSDVLGPLRVFIETAVRRQVRRYARVEETAARIAFAASIPASVESDVAKIPAAVALKASASLA